MTDRIGALSPQRRELLAALRRARRGPVPRGGNGPAPLSYAQRRLWFVHQMDAGTVAYNVPVVHRIGGPLDLDALRESLRLLIDRHAVLRTVYPERDGEPVQVVGPVPEPVLRLAAVDDRPEPERERAAMDLVMASLRQPFDLVDGPVMRATAVRLGPQDHLLALDIHHIACDQWSMGVFMRELAECYTALSQGREPRLPALPVTYIDYALWQRERLAGGDLAEGLRFWDERLRGLPEIDVPGDRLRPATASNQGAETVTWLPQEAVAATRALCAAEGASPFMVLLAGFVALLSRYTGEHDIAVGTTALGRESDAVAGLVGFFINTLVIRADVSGDPSFAELLGRVREAVLSADAHADTPFDLIVERLRPVRDPSRPPLVSIMFQQDNTPDGVLRLPGLDVRMIDDLDTGTSKYDLLVSVRTYDHGVRVHVQYDTALFDEDTVRRMLDCYRVLLLDALRDPGTPVSRLDLLPPAELDRITREWNDTAAALPYRQCLHHLLERQADERPDATAVVAGGERYSFRDLDRAANRLAHRLAALGVGPGTLVALHLPRTIGYLVAVLGVLKAGGAFVPIDPAYPRSRIEFVLDDADTPVLVTTAELAERLPATRAAVVVLGEDGMAADGDDTRPDSGVTPEDVCYVIYTSGSTGTPKGVVLRHRGVVNNLLDLNTRFGVGPGDSVLALSSTSFDMSVYELLGVPGAGGTVILPDPELARDPAHWAELIDEHGVTVWNSAPALLDLLLDHAEQSIDTSVATLRLALLGGDWVPVRAPDRLRALAPGLRFVNLGGATEASIHSIVYEVGEVDPAWTALPYGRPMANQEAYILDDNRQVLPVGVPGELYLGGVGVGKGYFGRPDLTAEKFVTWRNKIIYRTGDLARWRPDGVIELIGRRDFMLKVNGLRVEAGEVETALRAHPDVADAVVMARTDAAGDRQLAAYLLAETAVDVEDVRRHLAERLPAYMVPAVFTVLPEFPLSPNGKVDRARLARHESAERQAAVTDPPVGPLEVRVADAWRQVLGRTEINRGDDFFALGGDSFKAVRVARLIDPGLPVIAVFRHPTVAALAAHLATRSEEGEGDMLHRLTPERDQVEVNLICVPYGGGNAVAYQPLADALPERFALWSVDLPGHDLADPRPLAPITEVAARCAEEIRDRVAGPVALYGQCAGTAATLLLARRLEDLGVPVLATFMGAALPDPDPEASMKMLTERSQDDLLAHMRRLGGFDGALADDDIAGILRVVRHDLTEMLQVYLAERDGPPPKLSGPIHCLVGSADPATEGYETRYLDWARYGAAATLSVIEGGGHYFCKHQPDAVAGIVAERLAGELS
ncbi:non-ribosomal peptide synthetase [Thermoactinospora rubra]|uniref:non-ribosomal peptide synthetase n=1 Tax=Thermoactinospora rubra TaxID=1088767 RepID=UPI0013020146|nr:non-ribosomal peptide synthetase [Thermoactinospora rubra]